MTRKASTPMTPRAVRRRTAGLALLAALLGTAGCGQTGPLTLKTSAPPTSAPVDPNAEDADSAEDER